MINIPYYEVISDVRIENIEKVMPFLLLANWHGQRVASDMWLKVYYDPRSTIHFPQTLGFYEVLLEDVRKDKLDAHYRKGTLRLKGRALKEDFFALLRLDLGGNYNVDWLKFSPVPFDCSGFPQLPKYQTSRQRLVFPYVVKHALSMSKVCIQKLSSCLSFSLTEDEAEFWIRELIRIGVVDPVTFIPMVTFELFEEIFNVRLFGQKNN